MRKVKIFTVIAIVAILAVVIISNKNQNPSADEDAIMIDYDNDSHINDLNNMQVIFSATQDESVVLHWSDKTAEKRIDYQTLSNTIRKILPAESIIQITEKEVLVSGVLAEHSDMDILIENLKTISSLKRFDPPTLKSRPEGGVDFQQVIFLTEG